MLLHLHIHYYQTPCIKEHHTEYSVKINVERDNIIVHKFTNVAVLLFPYILISDILYKLHLTALYRIIYTLT